MCQLWQKGNGVATGGIGTTGAKGLKGNGVMTGGIGSTGAKGVNGEWGTNIRLLFGGGRALNDRTLLLCLVTESSNTFTFLGTQLIYNTYFLSKTIKILILI